MHNGKSVRIYSLCLVYVLIQWQHQKLFSYACSWALFWDYIPKNLDTWCEYYLDVENYESTRNSEERIMSNWQFQSFPPFTWSSWCNLASGGIKHSINPPRTILLFALTVFSVWMVGGNPESSLSKKSNNLKYIRRDLKVFQFSEERWARLLITHQWKTQQCHPEICVNMCFPISDGNAQCAKLKKGYPAGSS